MILIIAEKPSVAKKIANALGKARKKMLYNVPYYELERNGKKIVVASAVGHLFTLDEKVKTYTYPVFDVKWVPASVEKGKSYVNNYIKLLKKLSKEAEDIYIATDWDIEGELIGYHALKFCCGRDKAKRMRFSALTKSEIIKAFENPDSIDYGLVDAGESRHIVDWYFGINLSRALMHAIKSLNRWKVLSVGRVQAPTLAILCNREKEISLFKPKPYWVISAVIKNLKAIHEKEKFWDKEEAENIYNKIKDEKFAKVINVERVIRKIPPPPPFDLTELQREAYSYFKLSPKETQDIAQSLYEKGLCSYPRTSSQKLPRDEGYLRNILNTISQHPTYNKFAIEILKRNLRPVEGKKEDSAHPAIHIVDIPKEPLSDKEYKIYDLIARRTLAAFWPEMEREYLKVVLDIKGEKFKLSLARTIKEGWHSIYNFSNYEENYMEIKDKVKLDKILIEEKKTEPPKRYTLASLIKELEKRKLGTKCLTSNTLIKVEIDNIIKYMKIKDLFEFLNDKFKYGDIEFAINNKNVKCFSYKNNEIKSTFMCVSRRKLKENEVVYRIEFEDKSFVEVTEDHPILTYNGALKYIRAKKLKKGMKVVSPNNIKTILNIEKIDYSGYVYDIINSKYSNFIANDIVVHNSTRAEIIDKLISRGYVIDDNSLRVTDLGIAVIETLKKFCPEIVDEKLTRDLEEKLEKIQFKKIKKEDVLEEAKNRLINILLEFKKKEKDVGKLLISKMDTGKVIGKCKCGGDLLLVRDKRRFIKCSNCNYILYLPNKGRVRITNKSCSCGWPIIKINDIEVCTNKNCPKKVCPKCGASLVIREGKYGLFYGCTNYPNCKYTEPIKK
ncbi:DNA topoisomerase I [Methanocaldococcus villosus]|uniref:DNA topoisomerase I n=1 Tax=Methanocaldococcus villosus TaxID=667126 RepID=UPI0003741450